MVMADFIEMWASAHSEKPVKISRPWLPVAEAPVISAERIERRKQLAAVSGRTYQPPE